MSARTESRGAFVLNSLHDSQFHIVGKAPALSFTRAVLADVQAYDNVGVLRSMTARNGKPCKNCGRSEWYDNGQCVPCTRERGKEYYRRNKSKVDKRHKAWSQQNKDNAKERNKRYKLNHPGRVNEISRQWAKRNPEKTTAFYHKYRTNKASGGGAYSAAEWKSLIEHYGGKCLCCGRDDVKLTADHVVPVSKGGSSNIDNIQPLCQSCNSKKKDKVIDYRPGSGLGRWVQRKLFG